MKRRLFNLLAGLSLLLCGAIAVLWVDSNWRGDSFYIGKSDGTLWKLESSSRGTFSISHFRNWPQPGFHYQGEFAKATAGSPVYAMNMVGAARSQQWNWWQLAGWTGSIYVVTKGDGTVEWDPPFSRMQTLWSNHYSALMPFWELEVPYWIFLTLFSVLPAVWIIILLAKQFAQHWRHRDGYCRTCGYDLRATPDRCPECGTTKAPSGSLRP